MTGGGFDPSQQQRISDILLFGVATEAMQSEFHAAVELAKRAKKTTFYFWRSRAVYFFAVQCKKCDAVCVYEWQKRTTPHVDKLSAISWFTAFLDGNSTCCDDLGQLGQNSVIDVDDVESDDDMEDSEEDDVNSDEDEQLDGHEDAAVVNMES